MAPRTRRAVAHKQNHFDTQAGEDGASTPPGKTKSSFGGVLASLSNNVPAVKNSKGALGQHAGTARSETETLDSSNESLLKTPQLPKSVVVGKEHDICSPLTQPRIPKSRGGRNSPDNKTMEEEISVVSYETFSPLPKGRLARKQREVIEDDSSSSSEEEFDDDDTAEMDDDDIKAVDPNETILESDGSDDDDDDDDDDDGEGESESEIDLESEAESADDDESETDEDFEDSDDCEPDDDEYVPEEEEDSVSDEDLDDYVEEEKEIIKPPSRRNRQPKKQPSTSKSSKQTANSPKTDEGDKERKESIDDLANEHSESPEVDEVEDTETRSIGGFATDASENPETNEEDSICGFAADDATQAEQTPAKSPMSNDYSMCLDSPEAEVAVVVDDDDFDEDDDILVATILPDDEEEQGELGKGSSVPAAEDLQGRNFQAPDDLRDECPSCDVDDDRNDEDDTSEKRDTCILVEPAEKTEIPARGEKTEIPARGEEESSIHSGGVVSSGVGSETQGLSRDDNLVMDTSTPKPKRRHARKSFFRMEGLVKRGKWKLGSKIGVGSFGVVHVGMNNETGKLMAVKKFKVEDSIMEDIRREVELMRSLDHSNIVRYLGAQMDKTHLHIFQEWVPGGSVATLLGRFGPFSLQVIQSYLSQTLSGLAYLHENDIMHRDIKGSNILVNDEGIVKLADFGASKKLSNLRGNLMMSLTVRGTPYFMSPEVFEEKYSAKADIWGIGCVAYQMITGCPPWKDKGFSNPISLFNHIKKHTGPPPFDDNHKERLLNEDKNVYSYLCDLLSCCFSNDPASRPDASDLLQHKFFTEMHQDVDDESIYSRGLFSPNNGNASSPSAWDQSPGGDSEIAETPSPSPSPLRLPAPTPPKSLPRSKSVIQWRTTIASPPRQKRSTKKKQQSPICSSPYHSPEPDTSKWPEWARAEIQKRNLFESPGSKLIPAREENNLSAMMGSLALSEDSEPPSNNPFGRVSTTCTTDESKLAGLSLLNETNTTYEI